MQLVLAIAVSAALHAGAAGAQGGDTLTIPRLPPDVAREVVALYNATTTLRATTATEIAAGRVLVGNVAVLDGPLTIAGRVQGRVLAVNSDVIFKPGARIDGDLLVVGGDVEGLEHATVGGETRLYRAALRYTREGDELVASIDGPSGPSEWWRRLERLGQRNSNRLEVATAGVYNRVEGLPVRVGPVLYRDQGWGLLRMDAFAILRSASTFTGPTADVGHDVRAELRLAKDYAPTVRARLFDVVDGVETWQLSDAEVGLASFLFHRDYRDYYGRHGGQLTASVRPTPHTDVTLTYGDERWRSLETRDPWTLTRSGTPWRENPVLDEARMHVVHAALRLDTRNDVFNPFAGWFVLAEYEHGNGEIAAPGPTSPNVRPQAPGPTRYERGYLDMRRYNRLGPDASLNLRVVLGGWVGGDALPLERRLSIDGPGTVPGFDFRRYADVDVGTCATIDTPAGRPAQCERIALAQLEYRSEFRLSHSSPHEEPSWIPNRIRVDGAWVFFADAGRGWLVNAPDNPLNYQRNWLPPLSTYRTDIGGGLVFERIGVYVAKALSEPKEPVNVFLRVRHRF